MKKMKDKRKKKNKKKSRIVNSKLRTMIIKRRKSKRSKKQVSPNREDLKQKNC